MGKNRDKGHRPTLGLPGSKPEAAAPAVTEPEAVRAVPEAEPPRRRTEGDVVSLDPSDPLTIAAAHFGITPDELRARVEAGPVEEVIEDDLSALLAPATLATATLTDKPPRIDATALATAYVEAKKARLGPAALGLAIDTEIPYFETAVRKVLG